MIMADLKTNYVDDELDTTKNQLRKYQQIQNDDGTVSFVDVTEYTKVGTSFGAKDINDTNAAINYVNGNLRDHTQRFVTNGKSIYFLDKSYIDNKESDGFTIRIGSSSIGTFHEDTYYISFSFYNAIIAFGAQVNGATTITWYKVTKE